MNRVLPKHFAAFCIGLFFLIIVLMILDSFYYHADLGKPGYVLNVQAPPYEEAAKQFLEDKLDILSQLISCSESLQNGEEHIAVIVHSELYPHTDDFPAELKQLLLALNVPKDKRYEFFISEGTIRILTATEVCLDVYLEYISDFQPEASESEFERITILEDGWWIQTRFVPRG